MPLEMFSTVPVKVSVRVKNHLSQTILLYLYRFHLEENCNLIYAIELKVLKWPQCIFISGHDWFHWRSRANRS